MFEVRAFYHIWETSCWKCGATTPVLWAIRPPTNKKEEGFNSSWIGDYEVNPDQDFAMGEAIASKIQWFKRGYSQTMEKETYASFCTHCDSLQGNWYVGNEFFLEEAQDNNLDITDYVDYNTEYDAVANLHSHD